MRLLRFLPSSPPTEDTEPIGGTKFFCRSNLLSPTLLRRFSKRLCWLECGSEKSCCSLIARQRSGREGRADRWRSVIENDEPTWRVAPFGKWVSLLGSIPFGEQGWWLRKWDRFAGTDVLR